MKLQVWLFLLALLSQLSVLLTFTGDTPPLNVALEQEHYESDVRLSSCNRMKAYPKRSLHDPTQLLKDRIWHQIEALEISSCPHWQFSSNFRLPKKLRSLKVSNIEKIDENSMPLFRYHVEKLFFSFADGISLHSAAKGLVSNTRSIARVKFLEMQLFCPTQAIHHTFVQTLQNKPGWESLEHLRFKCNYYDYENPKDLYSDKSEVIRQDLARGPFPRLLKLEFVLVPFASSKPEQIVQSVDPTPNVFSIGRWLW